MTSDNPFLKSDHYIMQRGMSIFLIQKFHEKFENGLMLIFMH